MAPYRENPELVQQAVYISLWFIWASISIIYWLIIWKKYTVLKSFWMILIWWFVGWWAWVLTDSTLVSSFSWVLSLEIIHMVKEYWPELIKEKIKNILKLK